MSVYEDFSVMCIKNMLNRTIHCNIGIGNRQLSNPRFLYHAKVYTGGIVDLMMVVDECGEEKIYVFEMKSCKSDMCSGCGLNMVGDVNFVVKPSEEIGYMITGIPYKHIYAEADLHEKGLDDVGLLIVNKDESITCYRTAQDRSLDVLSRHIFTVQLGDLLDKQAHNGVSKEALAICDKRNKSFTRRLRNRWRPPRR